MVLIEGCSRMIFYNVINFLGPLLLSTNAFDLLEMETEPNTQDQMEDEPQTEDLMGSHEAYTEDEEESEPNTQDDSLF